MASPVLGPEKGDIYMVFDKDIATPTLKAMGTMASVNDMGLNIITAAVDPSDPKNNKAITEKFAANFDKIFAPNESVIVKLENGGEFLYIPGFVESVVPGAPATYTIGVAKDREITGVEEKNIAKNVPLTDAAGNNEGWFFSDTVLGSLLESTQTITYNNYNTKIKDIIASKDGARKIKAIRLFNSDSSKPDNDSYEIDTIKLGEKNITQVKMKSVVPFIYNTPADASVVGDPAKNHVVMTADPSKIIFGGKKSRKQKTRKNTMPLQFAPGAKRAYLKRRKSSRK